MNVTNKALSIIAFYLSEYDMDAVKSLGYTTRSEAINTISNIVGSGNNYLKLRRDEFDALPDSSSSRKGWRNRPPLKEVADMASYLHQFSFDELTSIVKSLIDNHDQSEVMIDASDVIHEKPLSEDEIEQIINSTDPTAKLVINTCDGKRRVYNKNLIAGLKKLYKGCCQICGSNPADKYNTSIAEAHHIDFFSVSHNNDAGNIIILCPNHHRLIHKLKPDFDSESLVFNMNDKVLFS